MRILVAGGGIGGLTAALCLQKAGCRVQVFEQSRQMPTYGTGIQLSPNTVRVLRKLGLAEQLLPFACRPQKAVIRDGLSGGQHFAAGLDAYAEPYLHISRDHLIGQLHQAALQSGVEIRAAAKITDCSGTGERAHCRLEDGTQHEGDLLVGADGIHSQVRRQVFGDYQPRYSGYIAWRGSVSAQQVSHQHLQNTATVWLGKGGHFVAYRIKKGGRINFVAVSEQKNWQHEGWSLPADPTEMRQVFGDWVAPVGEIVRACEECSKWALHETASLPEWWQGSAVLVGDACRAMLPFAAQGAAMAVEDAWVLAKSAGVRTIAGGCPAKIPETAIHSCEKSAQTVAPVWEYIPRPLSSRTFFAKPCLCGGARISRCTEARHGEHLRLRTCVALMSQSPRTKLQTQVLIAGAGPVGLTLALALGKAGISAIVVEKNTGTSQYPKMDITHASSMQLFASIGVASELRKQAVGEDSPVKVQFCKDLQSPALHTFNYPSPVAARKLIAGNRKGAQTSEPGYAYFAGCSGAAAAQYGAAVPGCRQPQIWPQAQRVFAEYSGRCGKY